MNRTGLVLIAMVLLLGCLGQEDIEKTTPTPTAPSVNGKTPSPGEVVRMNYIIRSQGNVLDATMEDVARASPEYEVIKFMHPAGFEPLTFIVGSLFINPDISAAVTNMSVGEVKTINIPPERSVGGLRRPELVQILPRFTILPLVESIPTPIFQQTFGIEPSPGLELALDYWNSTITTMDPEITTLTHNPENNSKLEFPGGWIIITRDNQTITMEFAPKINTTFVTPDERFVKIISSNQTHMVVDYNHPLAGKVLEVEITLEEISRPIVWSSNVEASLSESQRLDIPLFVLFTNTTCVTCRRIELELLAHPLVLSLKDEFLWIKVDTELQPETAQKYGADKLPLSIILKDGSEINRITEYLSPRIMRTEMESAFA